MNEERPAQPAPEPPTDIWREWQEARAQLVEVALKYGLYGFDECTASGDEE